MISDLLNGSWLNGLLRRAGHRRISERSPKVLVIGVGGAGGNALNNMIRGDLRGVEFCAVNTDVQALAQSLARCKVQIGPHATRGLGAGARVGFGQIAAEESLDTIQALVRGNDIVFVTAGMGGGTGTGAAPVIASVARSFRILTIGVVTKPFDFEGEHRQRLAQGGVAEMAAVTDTLLVIPNQNLFRVADAQTTLLDAFRMADDVLHAGVRAVTDLMTVPGLVNLDFADVRTIMADMGQATMGTGEAEGENRAIAAAAAAMSNPLIEQGSMSGARGVLINVTGGADLTLFDMHAAVDRVRREAAPAANIIFGSTFDRRLRGRIRISVVATGIGDTADASEAPIRDIVDREPPGFSVDADAALTAPAATGLDRRRGMAAAATGLAVIAAVGAGGLSLVHGERDRANTPETVDEVPGSARPAGDAIEAHTDAAPPSPALASPAWDELHFAALPEASGPTVTASAPTTAAAIAAAPKPPKRKKAPSMHPAPAASAQGYNLQIGALRNAESAQDELNRLRRTQGDLLAGLDSHMSRFELVNQGSVWRVRVGPIADRVTAETICSELRRRGAQCLLLAPPSPGTTLARR
jgi:cell division protein FtsZ